MNWEEAVKQLRNNPDQKQAILNNYFDADIDASVIRFSESEEFNQVLKYIPNHAKTVLDIGAGRGMASYGFAKRDYEVTALEPDPSNDVGAGAIKYLSNKHSLSINVVESFGESLPFSDQTFDVVYVRQVLHHAHDLAKFCKEVYRVLKPKGKFIATREHVLSSESDLELFLAQHPLHHLYGGEHAFTLNFYKQCIEQSGMHFEKILHPYQSVINYAPITKNGMRELFQLRLSKMVGPLISTFLIDIDFVYNLLTQAKATNDNTAGRLYSFIAIKK